MNYANPPFRSTQANAETAPAVPAPATLPSPRLESLAPAATVPEHAPLSAPGRPAPPAAVRMKPPYDVLTALQEVFAGRDMQRDVAVSIMRPEGGINRDATRLTLSSARSGYVYLLFVDKARSRFYLLFPNAVDDDNRILAGRTITLPRQRWSIRADHPQGAGEFVALVSDTARDFSAAGVTPIKTMNEFPADIAAERYRQYSGSGPLFAGQVVCSGKEPTCSELYGAARFSIREAENVSLQLESKGKTPSSREAPKRAVTELADGTSSIHPRSNGNRPLSDRPRGLSMSHRCSDILLRVSLGETLSADDQAMMRECR